MTAPDGAPWDLLVVGGGTAGLLAARTAARFGARVLLVDDAQPGGDCLWTGCVPSKSLLAAAEVAATARDGARFGVRVDGVAVDGPAVLRHVLAARAAIAPHDSAEALRADGVQVRRGRARFLAPGLVAVDGPDGVREERYHHAVVATGADPAVPPVPGLRDVTPLTTATLWSLTDLPSSVAVVGGGAIGCELGQALARLGVAVTLVEQGDRLLAKEDPDASALVRAALERDGVDVRVGAAVERVDADPDRAGAGTLLLGDGASVAVDRVLVAVGRRPATAGLGLDAVGVAVDEHGHVVVDERLRTTAPRVWAAGDVTGHPQFTHTAGAHGSTVAANAVLGLRRRVDSSGEPRVTFTDPEVAAVGVGTDVAAGRGLRVVTRRHDSVDRAVTQGRTEGWTRLVVDRRGRVVGAGVVGPRAGETLGELSLAVAEGVTLRRLAGVTHAYPTWNDGIWTAASDDRFASLGRGVVARVLRLLVRLRRRAASRG
ncbi:dihydrolipoyl dehydrogenase family protein [Aquipuribacter nitratireducens]|uniref:Dihydrolipoyl dehydrogenase family protein n=1 Tax=Aquipuribacter nitratireducens TaxID=650104 RepID=A0ABW0GHJ4_9MICO